MVAHTTVPKIFLTFLDLSTPSNHLYNPRTPQNVTAFSSLRPNTFPTTTTCVMHVISEGERLLTCTQTQRQRPLTHIIAHIRRLDGRLHSWGYPRVNPTPPPRPKPTQYSGMFIVDVRIAHYIAQTKVKDMEAKKLMTAAAGALWGGCGLLTLFILDEGKPPNLYINLGLQVFFGLGYAHQYFTMGSSKKD